MKCDSKDIMKRLHGIGIIPAVVLERAEDAVLLADALCKGGLPAAEIAFNDPAAHDAMIAMKKQRPELIIGAGDVLTKEQVDSAMDAGADFIASSGMNREIVEYCQEKGAAVCPGISTASELEQALALGLHTVKFFPAEAMGGIETIKALCNQYKNVAFLPVGGINASNMLDYLALPQIAAVGGSWMVDPDLIRNSQFDQIEKVSKDAVLKMLGMHVKHIGVNCTESDGRETADKFANLLQGSVRETAVGYFGSEMIEIMVKEHFGTKGHIAIGVNSVERALTYYRAVGIAFDEESITYDDAGDAKFAYFKEEIGGFKIHLVNN